VKNKTSKSKNHAIKLKIQKLKPAANLLTLQNQGKRLAASFAPLKIIAKNVGTISLV